MKKYIVIFAAIIMIIIAGIFLIGLDDNGNKLNTLSDTAYYKVGVISGGYRNNHAYTQALYEDLESIKEEQALEIEFRDGVETYNVHDEVVLLIEDGCNIIISATEEFENEIKNLSYQNPTVYFFQYNGSKYAPNLVALRGRMYQASFLAGIIAGNVTKTNEIGYIAARNSADAIANINAFARGVDLINKDAVVKVSYCESKEKYTESYSKAEELFDNSDIDIMTYYIDNLGACDVANKRGIKIIGHIMNVQDLYPENAVTSCEVDFATFFAEMISLCRQEKLQGSFVWAGVETGIIGLSEIKNTEDIIYDTQITYEMKGIMSAGIWDVFSNEIRDNKGKVRVEDGEWMTDTEIINNMDWYVEGVEIYE